MADFPWIPLFSTDPRRFIGRFWERSDGISTGIGNDKKRKLPSFDHLNEPYLERLAAVG
jgi:hypothetical protein